MIRLGEKATDKITGFAGVVITRSECHTGRVQLQIQPETRDRNGQPMEAAWFDEQRLTEGIKDRVGGL